MNFHRVWQLLIALSLSAVLNTHAGHPEPPQRLSQGRRDAIMALLQFQSALAADRWDDALLLCSTDVQNQAKAWPSAENFFKDTMPIEHVLARADFRSNSGGRKFYVIIEIISAYDEQPLIEWYWGIALAENGKWVVDYPPVLMSEYVTQRKAWLQERNDKYAALQKALEPKVSFISTLLVPVTNEFALGQPVRFRFEMTNAGPTDVYYKEDRWSLLGQGLVVRDERGTVLAYTNTMGPWQILDGGPKKLPAHSAVVFADALDFTKVKRITESGKYSVQFDGYGLGIGDRLPTTFELDRFYRPLGTVRNDFWYATNKFPSNVVTIDVRR